MMRECNFYNVYMYLDINPLDNTVFQCSRMNETSNKAIERMCVLFEIYVEIAGCGIFAMCQDTLMICLNYEEIMLVSNNLTRLACPI